MTQNCKETCCGCSCHKNNEHHHDEVQIWQPLLSTAMLLGGIMLNVVHWEWFKNEWIQLIWYIIAFLPVGLGVMNEARRNAMKGDVFSEFMLMSVAGIGAFAIGEYPEAVAVMLLYCIGEYLQGKAVQRAKGHIRGLMELKVERVRKLQHGEEGGNEKENTVWVSPEEIKKGDFIEVFPGERIPTDGILAAKEMGKDAVFSFNTAALTGESMPRSMTVGEEVLAGMIVEDSVVRIEVVREVGDSAISRILKMVEEASERKAPTELFIRRFAHIYTPIVFALALMVILFPWGYAWISDGFHYDFAIWLKRALVFLVISCPCALVVSIPLGYFAGIGAASKRGILFKGGNYLDIITQIDTVVFDKTGTMTTGEFAVQEVVGLAQEDLQKVAAMEKTSNHPIAKAIVRYVPTAMKIDTRDIPGYGLTATIESEQWLVGTLRLLDKEEVSYPQTLKSIAETLVVCAKNKRYMGHITLADTLKKEAETSVKALKNCGVEHIEMLSGDKQALVTKMAQRLGIRQAYGDLLPEDKARHIETLKEEGKRVAFVGDGINDAPVLALSHLGIAMGKGGADLAIETADMIVQTDNPVKVAEAIGIGRRTKTIIIQNITFAIAVKFLVMLLGLFDLANLWQAVFADSGVALLCVLNATRIFKMPPGSDS
ncbi:MAG: cadmium-translocating P-type ATPase [Prevotella sp.]|nr:cadmium-translocating P-type ATPase [Prevotella sp.]MDD7461122.1 heavy metal translocating P-type ATPase [Prevotellaceae bacterium]MDY3364980.1 heavy metal translocating P-type ATPase [Prevotella sp.]